jgi:DNA-binding response OmpR family regulator
MNGLVGNILIIDRQEYWRRLSARTLRAAGFEVVEVDDYSEEWKTVVDSIAPIDLIILGCVTVGDEERQLIEDILQHRHRLLVFCTSLPWRVMRSLFLLGAEDVTDKTYDPRQLLETVEELLDTDESRYTEISASGILAEVME